MSDSLDEIFDTSLNETESDIRNEVSAKSETENSINDPIPSVHKSPIFEKVFRGKELNELKRVQTQRIIELRQRHLSEEQATSDANNLKYRDFIWEISLNYFGRGSYVTDFRTLFEKKLVDEEFKLKKEILELQESQKEEIRMAKQMKNDNKQFRRTQGLLSPKEFAQQIFAQIQGFDNDDIYENDSMIDSILNKLTEANNVEHDSVSTFDEFEAVFVSPPKPRRSIPRKPFSPHFSSSSSSSQVPPRHGEHYSARKPHLYPHSPKYIHSPPMMLKKRPNRMLQRHIRERNKLKKYMDETDKFLQDMKRQSWFGEFM